MKIIPQIFLKAAQGGPDPTTVQVAAEETVRTSASATALGGHPPTGVGPPLGVTLPSDGQHWPHDATRSNVATHPTPAQASSPGQSEVLQQMHVHVSPTNGGASTTTTTLVTHKPHGHRPTDQQPNALPANAHSSIIHAYQPIVRNSPISTRQTTPTPVQPLTSITDADYVESFTIRDNPHQVSFVYEA